MADYLMNRGHALVEVGLNRLARAGYSSEDKGILVDIPARVPFVKD